MALYTEESLNILRNKIDLVEVLSAHMQLKRSGAVYKALCPFHEEKTPSFQVQLGEKHYHCFGCGAHGDAIAFLMNHVKYSFVQAVEALAERFGVTLEKTKTKGIQRGPDRVKLKEALELATQLYHTLLLHTKEGHRSLAYLYQRGISLECIRFFRIGFAPSMKTTLLTLAKGEGVTEEILLQAGLITEKKRDFFSDRILFPITDLFGNVIGFSARKIKEEVFGGKYINTSETFLFKKSQILFGLSYSRQRIAKERRVIIVEGQIDALQLIHRGCDFTVAAQGTAFGEGHVKLLTDLGVQKVFLAMDGDAAGKVAALKIGNLFQKKGIEVYILSLPKGSDPDSFIRKEGIQDFLKLLDTPIEYLPFLIEQASEGKDLKNPTQKNALLRKIIEQVRSWEEPILVHESLRKIAQLTKVPESVIGVGGMPQLPLMQQAKITRGQVVDPDRILEADLLRWMLLCKDTQVFALVKCNVAPDLFKNPLCKKVFLRFLENEGTCDLISLGNILEKEEEQSLLSEIITKKINLDKAKEGLHEVIHRLLIRKWMEEREAIKRKIQSGNCSEEEALTLAKAFDEIKKNQPVVMVP